MAFPFKVAAFDMDGTFLRDDKTFDRDSAGCWIKCWPKACMLSWPAVISMNVC